MSENNTKPAKADLAAIIESAHRLGVEMDEEEAIQWLTAMAGAPGQGDVVVDIQSGTYGHRVTMLDFSPSQLSHFREVGRLVEFSDVPGQVETALSLSGSAAQSKIQTYPGDADFFERVNIIAPTHDDACRTLAKIMREKILSTLRGPTHQFIEAKFGNFPFDVVKDGRRYKAGSPIAWSAQDVVAGKFAAFKPDGTAVDITWEGVSHEPGWCKLDWVIADPAHGKLANASNMLDVTWEAPDGQITPLDGYLDPYFQEVYLDASSVPIFSKLVKHMSSDALADYMYQLEKEVRKYVTLDPRNYGKAAKRMYNVFRLNGNYQEAAYLRELFDEPATLLYQIHALIRTIDDAATKKDSGITKETLLAQTDALTVQVVETLESHEEAEVVRHLLRLRTALADQKIGEELTGPAEAARAELINLVNNFFYDKLTGIPTIKAYIEKLQAE